MPVSRKTIILTVNGNAMTASDNDAGVQGEHEAVSLQVSIPADWQDLYVRLQVIASDGSYDESDYPVDNVITMPIKQGVTVPGRLVVRLKGSDANGNIRKTADCKTLTISQSAQPVDPIPAKYPNIIRHITGSGGALVTQTDDTTYNVNVTGAGGDMLQANYANGSGTANLNKVDHAIDTDKIGDKTLSDLLLFLHPIGDLLFNTSGTNPSTYIGGTWVAWGSGRVPVGIGSNGTTDYETVEAMGGEEKHTLTVDEMPSHNHTVRGAGENYQLNSTSYIISGTDNGLQTGWSTQATSSSGSGAPHNNMQPYITCYMWKRTA